MEAAAGAGLAKASVEGAIPVPDGGAELGAGVAAVAAGSGAGEVSVGGEATRMSGSTAGVSLPAGSALVDVPPPRTNGVSSEMLAVPDAWPDGSGAGGAAADEETSANAQSTPIKDGATNLFTTSPALLRHPGDHSGGLSFATLAPAGYSNNG